MTTAQTTIEERLQKLERQNRIVKTTGVAMLLIAGAFVLMGQRSQPRTQTAVQAKSFVLVDEAGRTRAALAMSPNGPVLGLMDANGKMRTELAELSSGPLLQFYDANGKMRADLTLESDTPGLSFYDASGEGAAVLAASEKGPELYLTDTNGNPRADLMETSAGPALELNDSQGFSTHIGATDLITPTTGETHKTSAASVVLFGKDKKVLWSAP